MQGAAEWPTLAPLQNFEGNLAEKVRKRPIRARPRARKAPLQNFEKTLGRKGAKLPDSRTAFWPRGPTPPPPPSLKSSYGRGSPPQRCPLAANHHHDHAQPAAPTHHRADAPLQGPTYAAIHASTHHLHKRVHARSRAPDDHGRTWPAGASPHDRPDTSLEPSAEN